MKKIILAVAALISFSAFAGPTEQWPKIAFGSVFVSVDGVCVAGDMLRTKQAIPVCSEWGRGEASSCVKEVALILSTPRTYIMQISIGEGSRYEEITQTHPLTYTIPVGYDGQAFHQTGSFEYTIAACAN
jgi:hypothetical protein